MPAYSLVAVNPRMKRTDDPNSRIYCRILPPSPNSVASRQVLKCQNATMSLFAERLRGAAPGVNDVDDLTGLDGRWDFSLSFNPLPQPPLNGRAGRGDAGQDASAAPNPAGGYTLFESIEKQLGLKLEAQKRMLPVVVIDRINQTPSDN